MPVIAPSRIACTGPTPKSSAFVAPVTQNRPQPDRVEDQDAALDALEHRPGEEADQPRRAGGREVAPVAEGRRRRADQQVAGDAAGQPDDGGQHDDAEQVEPGPHRGQPAAEAEDERPRQVEGEDQRRVEAVRDVHRRQHVPIGDGLEAVGCSAAGRCAMTIDRISPA